MKSNLRKERVLVLGSVMLIAVLAAFLPFALRIPTLAKSFTASASCVPSCIPEPPCCPTPGKVTGGGQINCLPCSSDPEAKASFGFNIVRYPEDDLPKGELQYVDHDRGMLVHGHDMTYLAVSADKTQAWFRGSCTIDHVSGFTFEVYVEDNGEPGREDVFHIELSTGYSAGWTLLHGNIQIHKKP